MIWNVARDPTPAIRIIRPIPFRLTPIIRLLVRYSPYPSNRPRERFVLVDPPSKYSPGSSDSSGSIHRGDVMGVGVAKIQETYSGKESPNAEQYFSARIPITVLLHHISEDTELHIQIATDVGMPSFSRHRGTRVAF